MPVGSIGAVATLLNTVASWVLSEQGLATYTRKQMLRKLHTEALHALERGDLAEYRRVSDELRVLVESP